MGKNIVVRRRNILFSFVIFGRTGFVPFSETVAGTGTG